MIQARSWDNREYIRTKRRKAKGGEVKSLQTVCVVRFFTLSSNYVQIAYV